MFKRNLALFLLVCIFVQTNHASTLSSVLQSNQITGIGSMVFSSVKNPTIFESSGQNTSSNVWLNSAMDLPTSVDFKNGVYFTFTNFLLMCNGQSCISFNCTVFDNSGASLIQATNLKAIDKNSGGYASVNGISVWLKSLKQITNISIPCEGISGQNSAIFAANVTWPVSRVMGILPPVTTSFGAYLASNGLTQVVGASLSKAGIEEDISVVVLTSKSSAVQSPTIAIYTLTGSSSCTSDITDVENGIYMAVSSWASGASYFLSDSKGNQLGTGTITAFGTASGTILGALVCGSGTNSAAVPAVSGVIPQAMLLQYPTPKPYSGAASTGKKAPHKKKKHVEKEIKKLNHLITKNQTAQSTYASNVISGGVLLNQVIVEDVKFLNKQLVKLQSKLSKM